MDKPRNSSNKVRSKGRALPPPGDFIALGSKSRSVSSDPDLKPIQLLARKPVSTASSLPISSQASALGKDKRRDVPGPISIHSPSLQKQGKLAPSLFSPTPQKTRDLALSRRNLNNESPGPSVALVDCSPLELERRVLEAHSQGQIDQVEGLLCGALKTLKINRMKPDPLIYLTLIGLAKTKPDVFQLKPVTQHLLMFLKRETSTSAVKPKPNPLLTSMACNILTNVFQNEDNWPQSFIKAYVDDALGDRSWVDSEHCKVFVDNIITAFGTVMPAKATAGEQPRKESLTISAGEMLTHAGASDEQKILKEFGITVTADEPASTIPRYASPTMESAVQYYIQDIVKEQLTKRQVIDGVSRNMLRFLASVCGYSEVRLLASQKVESWLQNPKLTRPAQELLMSVAMNCNTHMADDIEVIGNFVKLRLKPKPLANHYIACIRELVNQHPDNLGTTLKHVIYNELGQQRNPNNMSVLQVIFQIEPENAAKYLALVFQDLLVNREEYLKPLKALFREIVRILRYEINFSSFCRGLMQERNDTFLSELEQNTKDRVFSSLVSLIAMSMLTSVSPAVREIAVAMGRGEKRDLSVLQEFQTQISLIQRDAVWWFHTKVIPMFNPHEKEYISCLNKVMFLESNDCYQSKDSWPSENEVGFLLNLVRDVPLVEDALIRILCLGLSEEFPMNCADALDIIERLAQRSAVLRTGLPGLEVERQAVIEMLLSLSVYSHPKEISLPTGYQPPQLCISNLYWKGWTILLILAACNPMTIGLPLWQSYPTSRTMMEMVITRNYSFPPLATGECSIEEIKSAELQLSRAEKDDILVFESHLAAATTGKSITKETSLLIDQLISLDPSGPSRHPPKSVIDHMKILDKSLGLDYMFCKSRNPDFLLDIIHSQGSTRSMPWLADLVESSESSLNVLPSQCLCEFLLMKDGQSKLNRRPSVSHEKRSVYDRVVDRLQSLLKSEETTEVSTVEIMEYFFNRLQSNDMKERDNSVKAMKAILKQPRSESASEVMDVDSSSSYIDELFVNYLWFLREIPLLKHFKSLLPTIVLTIRQAMYAEMDLGRLRTYILFIHEHIDDVTKEQLDELTEDISQLVTTRGTLLNGLVSPDTPHGMKTYEALLKIYTKALLMSMDTSELQWSDNQEQVYVSWSDETIHSNMSANLHVRVIHAVIVLLTTGPPCGDGQDSEYKLLLDTWFPEQGHYEVRLADTGEEAFLLQDWLRMKMVTSNVSRLVDTALQGLSPGQLVMFMQTFGLPVASISKLLHCLDKAVVEDPVELSQAVVDRDYLYQLVEVRWARGATGGEKLCEFLGQDFPSAKPKPVDLAMLEEPMTPFPVQMNSPEYNKEEIRRPTIYTKDSLEQLLLKVYFEEKTRKETMEGFSELKKCLAIGAVCSTKDRAVNKTLLLAINEILNSEIKDKFIESMFAKPEVTCSLLRLLSKIREDADDQIKLLKGILKILCSKGEEGTKVATCLKTLCEQFQVQASPLEETQASISKADEMRTLMTSFIRKDNTKSRLQVLSIHIAHVLAKGVRNGSLKPADLDMSLLLETCNVMQQKCMPLLQKVIDATCNCFIEASCQADGKSFDHIKKCVQFLVALYKHGKALNIEFSIGICLDWLDILDPEIVHADPLLQRELLFVDKHEGTTETMTNRSITTTSLSSSYLQALLAHQSKSNALHDCLDWFLSVDTISTRLNPTAALDLISSVVQNPNLWQGRDSKQNSLDEDKGRRINDEVMLDLATPQICKLVDLILSEMEMNCCFEKEPETSPVKRKQDQIRAPRIAPQVLKIAEKRLTLLLNHIQHLTFAKMEKVVSTIRRQKRFPKAIISCLLQQIYLQRPSLIGLPKQELLTKESADMILGGEKSPTDEAVHRIFLSIANLVPTSSWDKDFSSSILVCRRLATKHPYLVLRHLSTFMTSLQGRHRIGASEFKRANQIILYTQILSLLDLLRPYIFIKNQIAQDGLSRTIEVFIDLIQSVCLSGSELAAVVTKFVEFLNNFIAYDSSYAFSLLFDYQEVFRGLYVDHAGFTTLKFLTTFLSMCEESATDKSKEKHEILSAPVIPILSTPWTERQLLPIRQKLSQPCDINVIVKVLNDLDETSKRRVDILQHFLTDLMGLLTSTISEIRDRAHNLLLRHYRQDPRKSRALVDCYTSCLLSDNEHVAYSAAKFLPQLILFADNGCAQLLEKLFALSITVNPACREFVSKAEDLPNEDLQIQSFLCESHKSIQLNLFKQFIHFNQTRAQLLAGKERAL
eukprot:gene9152-10125_t